MSYNFEDDEPVVSAQDHSGLKPSPFVAGKTQVRIINKNEIGLQESRLEVLLEITGAGSGKDRPGVDIVTVLDVSENMDEKKLEDMKTAMKFLIKKLSSIDRLSIVAMAEKSSRLCPLRRMTENGQMEVEELVNGFSAHGQGTDIAAGLDIALQVLEQRTHKKGRVQAVMLTCSSKQSPGSGKATNNPSLTKVPVYTFGFGRDYDPEELNTIATKSKGGTFSVVDIENAKSAKLSVAFAQCLGGFLTVAVQQLKLRVKPTASGVKVKIEGQPTNSSNIVEFHDLYTKETRKVLAVLTLPPAKENVSKKVFEINYSYQVKEEDFDAPPLWVTVTRTDKPQGKETEELEIEAKRLEVLQKIKAAREDADKEDYDGAQRKLVQAQNILEDVNVVTPHPLIEMLKYELYQLVKLTQSKDIYEKEGRAFLLASETSHDTQRFAARGNAERLRLFSTPRMDEYLDQANKFEENPSKPPPSANDDAKQEYFNDPLAHIVGPFHYQLQQNIKYFQELRESIESIQKVVHKVQI